MTASQIAAFNNRREAQWGVSPRDRHAVLAASLRGAQGSVNDRPSGSPMAATTGRNAVPPDIRA
jgi:hypothetical protein